MYFSFAGLLSTLWKNSTCTGRASASREERMKLSIVTVVYNGVSTVADAIEPVLSRIEYIIIDGDSKDGTNEVLSRYRSRIHRIVSEPDKGIYDAMNKP